VLVLGISNFGRWPPLMLNFEGGLRLMVEYCTRQMGQMSQGITLRKLICSDSPIFDERTFPGPATPKEPTLSWLSQHVRISVELILPPIEVSMPAGEENVNQ